MEDTNTWIVCKHVMDGSAEKVQIRRDKVCMCLACADDPTVLNTHEINILEEPQLMERLSRISQAFDEERHEKKAG